jgi:LDH2 family malate/lactate/ureidoglycolate dehydrogenase
MALDYGIFGEKAAIKDHFARFLQELRDSPKASGETRVFIHGEKETESRIKRLANGIPVDVKTRNSLREISDSCALDFESYFGVR